MKEKKIEVLARAWALVDAVVVCLGSISSYEAHYALIRSNAWRGVPFMIADLGDELPRSGATQIGLSGWWFKSTGNLAAGKDRLFFEGGLCG